MKTTLHLNDILVADWPKGSVASNYRINNHGNLLKDVAIKEHVAAEINVSPALIDANDNADRHLPFNRFTWHINELPDEVTVSGEGPEPLDWQTIHQAWLEIVGRKCLLVDICTALLKHFLRRLVIHDPASYQSLHGRPVLYFANHQTSVETLLFMSVSLILTGLDIGAIARTEHKHSWIGLMMELADSELGPGNPIKMLYFNRDNQAEMFELLDHYMKDLKTNPYSLIIHVEGKLEQQAGYQLKTMSSVLLDFAIAADLPIVPVRFAGGLPWHKGAELYDFPYQFGMQDYYIGTAILPVILKNIAYSDRPSYIVDQINQCGPTREYDKLLAGDKALSEMIETLKYQGLDEIMAVFYSVLRNTWPSYDKSLDSVDELARFSKRFGQCTLKTERL